MRTIRIILIFKKYHQCAISSEKMHPESPLINPIFQIIILKKLTYWTDSLTRKNLLLRKTTKISLILPLFRILGYDTENPDEVKAEYVCDVGVKTLKKVVLTIH